MFRGVLEEVVLLLAEGSGGADCLKSLPDARPEIAQILSRRKNGRRTPPATDEKWMPALVARDAFAAYRALTEARFEPLSAWGGAYLGAVTGSNRFFALTVEEASRSAASARATRSASRRRARAISGASPSPRRRGSGSPGREREMPAALSRGRAVRRGRPIHCRSGAGGRRQCLQVPREEALVARPAGAKRPISSSPT